VVIPSQSGITDATFHQRVGNCPVSAGVFTGNKFGINETVLVPLRQNTQRLLHGGLNRRIRQLAVVVVPLAALDSIRAVNHCEARGGKAVGILFTVAIRIIVGKLLHQVLEFVQCCRGFCYADFFHPVAAVYHRLTELVGAVDANRNRILFSVKLADLHQRRIVCSNQFDGVRHILCNHVLRNLGQKFLTDVVGKVSQGIDIHHVRIFSAGKLGAEHVVPVRRFNAPEIDLHIELFVPVVDHDRIITKRAVLCADPGDLVRFVLRSSWIRRRNIRFAGRFRC